MSEATQQEPLSLQLGVSSLESWGVRKEEQQPTLEATKITQLVTAIHAPGLSIFLPCLQHRLLMPVF